MLDVLATGVDHRLDGEGHSRDQFLQGAGPAVVQHLWLFVKHLPDAMAAELTHDAEAVAFGKALYRPAHVAQTRSGTDYRYAVPHRFIGQRAKPARSDRGVADQKHTAGVAVPTVLDHRDVDVDDVALLERLVIRYAVADLVVDRGADRLGIGDVSASPVVQRRWDRLLHLGDVGMREPVDLVGADPGVHMRDKVVQHFGRQPAGGTHAGDSGGVFVGDCHCPIIPFPIGFPSPSWLARTVSRGSSARLKSMLLPSRPPPRGAF